MFQGSFPVSEREAMNAGRTRSFDKDVALDKAMHVFWSNGYSGTSFADLVLKLGVNKPSLYAAFGNKEQLFEATIKRYMTTYATLPLDSLRASPELSMAERIRQTLQDLVAFQSAPEKPLGCFLVNCNCELGGVALPEKADLLLKKVKSLQEKEIHTFFLEAQQKGELQKDCDTGYLSNYFLTAVYGLAVQARTGKSRKELEAIADYITDILPLD